MKEILEDIKLNRVAYLIEIIEKKDYDEKIKAFRKLQKIKITKNIGLYLIENSCIDYGIDDDYGGIGVSLIELCFKNYLEEYTDAIRKIFPKLTDKSKKRVAYLLTTTNSESALILYADMILKYFKDKEIPIGNLHTRPEVYTYIFPRLYKALKFNSATSNILVLISNYLNSGVVPKDDMKKNKKLVIDAINRVFDYALKLKVGYKNSFQALNNFEYKTIRYYLELAINIEIYVSNTKTREYLEKLFKKNDNQLKLFILDNYLRKDKDIKKLPLLSIARDPASRYALFEFLSAYEKIELFPSKYLSTEKLAESDFYINFAITNSYLYEAKSIKLIDVIERNNYNYYIFKFKCTYKYSAESEDFLTNYICNVVGIEKYNGQEVTSEFIGVSGGYNKDKEVSLVEYNYNSILYKKIDDDNQLDSIIEELIPKKIEEIKVEEVKKTKIKNKKENTKKIKEKTKKEKISKDKKEKKSILKKNKHDKKIETKELNSLEFPEVKKKKHIFDYFLLFLFFVFEIMLIYCMLYVNDVANIGGGVKKNPYKAIELLPDINFEEINGDEIFNRGEEEYYVLLYKKNDNPKNSYFTYINEYLIRNIKMYYVNTADDKNKFLFEPNSLNFIITKDRLLKVKNGEYAYYIDGRMHILDEMQSEINDIKIKEAKELKEQEQEKKQQVDK